MMVMERQKKKLEIMSMFFFSSSHQLFYKNYLPGGAADEFVVGL